jgi:hypothetical protein
LPKAWFAVAIGASFVATLIVFCYTASIQLVVFPLFLFIDAQILFALDATRMPPDSLSVISLGAIYTTAVGAVIHVAAVPLLFLLNLFLIVRSRAVAASRPTPGARP